MAKIRQTVTAIDKTVGDVKGDVADATKTVAESVKHIDEIIIAAQDPIEKFTGTASRISEDASAIIARVRAGEGSIGKLVNDDALYNSVSAKAIQQAMENLRQTSMDMKELVSRFKSGEVPADIARNE